VTHSSFSVYGQLKVKLQEWNQAFVLLAQEDPRLTTNNSSSTDPPVDPPGASLLLCVVSCRVVRLQQTKHRAKKEKKRVALGRRN
jgi:hypothetical protein